MSVLEVIWYDDDRLKVVVKGAGPVLLRQAHLTGQGSNVVIDLIADLSDGRPEPDAQRVLRIGAMGDDNAMCFRSTRGS
jgi:hypothetical protein